jgi:hypothetical protein
MNVPYITIMIDQADPLTVLAASPVFAALPAAAAAELATLAREEVL